mmetsp:Transcript_68063/g.153995  ORF Transcript_68063/g.153995 Transcript_68063/m.153995 type:complete len:85 (+) Transcript_68063:219-473(+)|eukprot:CAMPEP_0172584624 /NCGR_PEP_ID=MMETSP1068-20121228/4234_1 /TAXON_ID=35684 /ORGANISM="Pseudopedinella elastica, Strain CCMP716" /LENGTH=84 /DNA_ID=CAMNT_0013378875 /DNA_START=108 /DNA_END=362 /DNA_ORIENTATION=-
MDAAAGPTINEKLVGYLMRQNEIVPPGAKPMKLTDDARKCAAELLRLFVVEAVQRASFEAVSQDETDVQPTHVEDIMTQLLLDF